MPERKLIEGYPYMKYKREIYTEEESVKRSREFYQWMDSRRTVREFSDKHIPEEIIHHIIKTASTAPSGAHKQPWTFCVVSNTELKRQIREAAEEEEKANYSGRMSDEWLEDLAPLGTNWEKPFLETAPYLIVVFKRSYELAADGQRRNNYYTVESVGIACGFLIAAIHNAGLVTLTHTPSPMNFLSKLLKRPENEKPYLLLLVGYPASEVYVPELKRKRLEEVAVFYE